MVFKLLTAVLLLLLAAENVYILMHRHLSNRLKPVEEYEGYAAFDTATGQLCRTFRARPAAAREEPRPSMNPSSSQSSRDAILGEIDKAAAAQKAKEDAESDARIDFLLKLPACADIR